MGMDVYGKSGNYFRANVWSWRPIHQLCRDLNDEKHLGLNMEGWGMNDGKGLHTQADCDLLATAIEAEVTAPNAPEILTIDAGVYVDERGCFLPPGQKGKSAYWTDKDHVLEFAKFLRECGGSFEIN